jgi:hypothetical protein
LKEMLDEFLYFSVSREGRAVHLIVVLVSLASS